MKFVAASQFFTFHLYYTNTSLYYLVCVYVSKSDITEELQIPIHVVPSENGGNTWKIK